MGEVSVMFRALDMALRAVDKQNEDIAELHALALGLIGHPSGNGAVEDIAEVIMRGQDALAFVKKLHDYTVVSQNHNPLLKSIHEECDRILGHDEEEQMVDIVARITPFIIGIDLAPADDP